MTTTNTEEIDYSIFTDHSLAFTYIREMLSDDLPVDVLAKIAQHPAAQAADLMRLIDLSHDHHEVVFAAAAHPNSDEDTHDHAWRAIIETDNDEWISTLCRVLLQHDELSDFYFLLSLSHHEGDLEVLNTALNHPNLQGPHAFYSIVQSSVITSEMLQQVLDHPNVFGGALGMALKSPAINPDLLNAIRLHPKFDDSTRGFFIHTAKSLKDLMEHLTHPEAGQSSLFSAAYSSLANDETYRYILEHPATEYLTFVRVAESELVSKESLEKVFSKAVNDLRHPYERWCMVKAVAKSPGLTEEMIWMMMGHQAVGASVLNLLAKSPVATTEILEELQTHPRATDNTRRIARRTLEARAA